LFIFKRYFLKMKFAVLALLGLVTVTQANQLPLEDSVSLYEDVEELDEDLTSLLKISINRKNAEAIDSAIRPLDNAAMKVAMKQGKIAQKDLMAIAQSK